MSDEEEQVETEEGEEECPRCGGEGYITIKEGDPEFEELKERYGDKAWAYRTQKRCICTKRERFRAEVGDRIYNADKLEESSLADRNDENLFIEGYPHAVLPHIRYVMAKEGFNYFQREVNDMHLRDIYVGNHDKFDSLSECVEKPDIVFLTIGVLSYENVAMPGIIMECLRLREYKNKPTWIINKPDDPFNESHEAYSAELDHYIDTHFNYVRIESEIEESEGENEKAKAKERGQEAVQNGGFDGLM